MIEFSNEDKLNVLAGARALGFEYHNDNSGRLVCTIAQLLAFSANVATATMEQIADDFNKVKQNG